MNSWVRYLALTLIFIACKKATQMALLKSSSNSGFIARQVAAAKTRFKELTVPELR
jgi:hypothetical protein